MNSVKGWYYGWKATLKIMLFERDLYRQLKKPLDIGDFGPVAVPDPEHQAWLDGLKPGDVVCDYRFRHLEIVARDGDDVMLSDGSSCSLSHCCDPADHAEPHPEEGE